MNLLKTRLGNINNTNDLKTLIASLELVKHKGKEHWNPIDIIVPIASGTAGFIIGENGIDCLTFYPKTDQYSKEQILWVWTASAKGNNPMYDYMDDIKELATGLECTSVSWSSKRKGYLKRMPKVGGDVHLIEYKITL